MTTTEMEKASFRKAAGMALLLVFAGAVKWFVPRLFVSSEEFEVCLLPFTVVEGPFWDYLVAAVPTGSCLLVALLIFLLRRWILEWTSKG